ncbi:HIRA-interacting protein 3 [Centroberyx gerrardi]
MVSEEETRIRKFVCRQLRDAPDLSTLTLGILKRRYLALVGHEALSPEARSVMKRVVEEELMKMQDSDKDVSESESPPTAPPQNKRKREKESEEETSRRVVDEGESRAKKFRRQSSSSEDCKTGSEESEEDEQMNKIGDGDEEQRVRKSQEKTNGISEEEERNSEDCAEEERNVSEKHKQGKISAENSSDDDEKRMVKKRAKNTQNGRKRTKNTSEGEESSPSQRDGEDEIGTDGKKENTQRRNSSESSEEDSEKEGKVLKEKKNAELVEDSDSSSLPSLEDEQDSGTEKTQVTKKKKTKEKKEDSENIPKKDGNKAVVRLKRYIGLCGVRRNYKKLLGGCRSIRSKVAVLKKELEDLGVQGQPSIEKCKKARLKREDAEELAALDVSNIITTQGRPKRGASAWQKQPVPPSSTYQRMVNSSSDSDEPSRTGRGRRRASDWGNLQGIISDDGDSG